MIVTRLYYKGSGLVSLGESGRSNTKGGQVFQGRDEWGSMGQNRSGTGSMQAKQAQNQVGLPGGCGQGPTGLDRVRQETEESLESLALRHEIIWNRKVSDCRLSREMGTE